MTEQERFDEGRRLIDPEPDPDDAFCVTITRPDGSTKSTSHVVGCPNAGGPYDARTCQWAGIDNPNFHSTIGARDSDYYRTYDFYVAVVAVLLAGDVQARTVSNPEVFWIEVSLIDGTKVLWTNSREYWGYSYLDQQGEVKVAEFETLPWDVDVADVAQMIAMHDYPVAAEFPEPQ